jgi:dihydropteroate synthase
VSNSVSWACGKHTYQFSRPRAAKVLVAGIINATPDSFSDGGQFLDVTRAVQHGQSMVDAGTDFVDVGGESSRPGAVHVGGKEELRRVIPVIEALAGSGAVVSVDTMTPSVMCGAVAAGASIVNDIHGFRSPGAVDAIKDTNCGLIVMHMQGLPRTMQDKPTYQDVVREVRDFFNERIEVLLAAGVALERIAIDPGIGFGKTLEHNISLLKNLDALRVFDRPLMIGVSRKKTIGALTGRDVEHRDPGTLAANLAAMEAGADIIRTHDATAMVDALAIWKALR